MQMDGINVKVKIKENKNNKAKVKVKVKCNEIFHSFQHVENCHFVENCVENSL